MLVVCCMLPLLRSSAIEQYLLQDARHASNTALLAEKVQEFDSELNKYIPILMAQAHIYWEIGQYSSVIKVFNQSREFAAEHEMWKLNVAHAYFMMVHVCPSFCFCCPCCDKMMC